MVSTMRKNNYPTFNKIIFLIYKKKIKKCFKLILKIQKHLKAMIYKYNSKKSRLIAIVSIYFIFYFFKLRIILDKNLLMD